MALRAARPAVESATSSIPPDWQAAAGRSGIGESRAASRPRRARRGRRRRPSHRLRRPGRRREPRVRRNERRRPALCRARRLPEPAPWPAGRLPQPGPLRTGARARSRTSRAAATAPTRPVPAGTPVPVSAESTASGSWPPWRQPPELHARPAEDLQELRIEVGPRRIISSVVAMAAGAMVRGHRSDHGRLHAVHRATTATSPTRTATSSSSLRHLRQSGYRSEFSPLRRWARRARLLGGASSLLGGLFGSASNAADRAQGHHPTGAPATRRSRRRPTRSCRSSRAAPATALGRRDVLERGPRPVRLVRPKLAAEMEAERARSRSSRCARRCRPRRSSPATSAPGRPSARTAASRSARSSSAPTAARPTGQAKCTECGNDLPPGTRFCGNCGTKVS